MLKLCRINGLVMKMETSHMEKKKKKSIHRYVRMYEDAYFTVTVVNL